MFQQFIIFCVIFLAAVIQVSFFSGIFSSQTIPDVVLALIIFWTVRMGFEKTWKRALAGGLMLDFFSFWPVGANMLTLVFVSMGLNSLTKRFFVAQATSRTFILAGLVVSGAAVNAWMLILMGSVLKYENAILNFSQFFNQKLLIKIGLDLALFALVYLPLLKLEKFLGNYSARAKTIK